MVKRKKYERSRFDLAECKAEIMIIGAPKSKGRGYGVAFLNVTLPDGRWIPFKMQEACRVPMYKEEAK